MIPEYAILEIVQYPLAYQAKIGHVLFTLPGVSAATLPAVAVFQRNCADAFGFGVALTETVEASPKNGAKNASAWRFRLLAGRTEAVPLAERTGRLRQSDGCRAIPLHL